MKIQIQKIQNDPINDPDWVSFKPDCEISRLLTCISYLDDEMVSSLIRHGYEVVIKQKGNEYGKNEIHGFTSTS